MGVSFFENMHGELTCRWGTTHAVDFELRAEATRFGRFMRDGSTRLSGIVNAPPWAEEAPLQGQLHISPVLQRRLRYHITFSDEQGTPYRLAGEKSVNWLRPVSTMTHMEVQLHRQDELVATGEMRFELGELLAFAASWTPWTSIQPAALFAGRDLPGEPRVLDAADQERLWALAEAIIEPGEHVPPPGETTIELASLMIRQMPSHMLFAYRWAFKLLDVFAVGHTGRRFVQLPLDRRKKLLKNMSGSSDLMAMSLHGRRLLQTLSLPIKGAHFSREDYLRSLGFPTLDKEVNERPPDYMRQVTSADQLDAETDIEAEVVIVGTGAGGGALAAELAQRGVAVALLEEGQYHQRQSFSGSPLDRTRRLWRHAAMGFSVGRPPISIPLGRLVGGTTAINSGTCFRAPNEVLREWRHDLGFPADFEPEAMAPRYASVEAELQVAPAKKPYVGRIADVVAQGAEAMGLDHGPLPRNAPDCDGQGTCILGCPTDAKRSTNISYVPRALRAGAALFTGLPVTQILMRGRRAVGVEARGADSYGARKVLRVRAEAVVISCGSINTPRMLANSGFRLPMLGKNLSVHPGQGMWGLCDHDMEPWNAIPQGYGVKGFENDGICFEGFYVPPQLGGATVPMMGHKLSKWMDVQRRVAQFGFMIKDEGTGSVSRSLNGSPLIRYSLSDRSVRCLKKGSAILAEMLLRGGAREVLTFINGIDVVRTMRQARALADQDIRAIDFNLLGAHPLGTCRLGTSVETGVVDFDHRVFGTDNLYVVDGGNVPTSLGVNPQMTIMAFAIRAAEILASRVG